MIWVPNLRELEVLSYTSDSEELKRGYMHYNRAIFTFNLHIILHFLQQLVIEAELQLAQRGFGSSSQGLLWLQ